MRFGHSLFLTAGLALACTRCVHAQTNTLNLNFTGGFNDLSYSGHLNLGDLDILPFYVIPDSNGVATFTYNDRWTATSPGNPGNQYINQLLFRNNAFLAGAGSTSGGTGSVLATFNNSPTGIYVLDVFSSTTPATITPTGSTVAGDFSITHLRGLNGTVILAVPEPGNLALLAGMGTVGVAFLRRRKQARLSGRS